MFIGHLPAAYISLKTLPAKIPSAVFTAALVGSILPDADLFYFYLIDGRQHHHHDYLTHRPALWFGLLCVGIALSQLRLGKVLLGLSSGAVLHLLLDSIVGKIGWLWPLSSWSVPLVVVPSTYDYWVLSFLTHWTFCVEILITLIALLICWRTN